MVATDTGNALVPTAPSENDMVPFLGGDEPIAVESLLSALSMNDLETLPPFYVTNIRYESTDFANTVERNGEKVVYLFEVIDAESGEVLGTVKTATRGLIEQMDKWLSFAVARFGLTNEQARLRKYGPVSAGRPMTRPRDGEPSRPAKSVKFVPPITRTKATVKTGK